MAELPVESVEEPGSKAIVSAKNNEQPLRRKKEELGELKQFERILSHLDKFAKPAATKLGQRQKPAKNEIKKIGEITYCCNSKRKLCEFAETCVENLVKSLIFGKFQPVRTTYTKLAVSRQSAGETIRKL